MSEERPVVIVQRNGSTQVVTGWRAMLLAASAVVGGLAALVLLGFLFIGVAVTVGAVLVIAVPAAIIFAVITALMGRRGQP